MSECIPGDITPEELYEAYKGWELALDIAKCVLPPTSLLQSDQFEKMEADTVDPGLPEIEQQFTLTCLIKAKNGDMILREIARWSNVAVAGYELEHHLTLADIVYRRRKDAWHAEALQEDAERSASQN